MNKDVVATWPKDFETGLPVVPPGEFTDFSEYKSSKQPARIRKLPVLRGFFDGKRFDTNPDLPTHIGWGLFPLGNTTALAFRVQRGANMLYWLANPADPNVWQVLDKWAASNAMVLAAEFEDGPALLIQRDFNLRHPVFNGMREAIKAQGFTKSFVEGATQALASDRLRKVASTDIPAYLTLENVQGCMVRTEHTGGVALMLRDKAPGPGGVIADAAQAFVNALVQPEQPRH